MNLGRREVSPGQLSQGSLQDPRRLWTGLWEEGLGGRSCSGRLQSFPRLYKSRLGLRLLCRRETIIGCLLSRLCSRGRQLL